MNTCFSIYNDLLYCIKPNQHRPKELHKILQAHPEVCFVSLTSVDIAGNDTDAKIPIRLFLEEIDSFLNGAVQTDGSSVVLPLIADINDAQVDFIADADVNWYVDYNYENTFTGCGKPCGTLRIPCFLRHNGNFVCSRSLLRRATNNLKENLLDEFNKYPELLAPFKIKVTDIEDISLTIATELEFWVRTPDDVVAEEHLSTSQGLKEQYWKRTKGVVRSAIERSLILLDCYGFNPEMGHKEVGGVKAHLTGHGDMDHIVEQLEIDWAYNDALQAVDNELAIRILIKEIFRLHGLEASFNAKPIPGVAGSGEHTHINIILALKNGKRINLFAPQNVEQDFLSPAGYGALMGIMKHYNTLIAPFVTCSNDAFARLKPGFEAPTHAVATIGRAATEPSRNRTVLLSVIRSMTNSRATRFELRSPAPHTNLYFAVSAICQAMLDGIEHLGVTGRAAVTATSELHAELTKEAGQAAKYLYADYAYCSEEDIFTDYTSEERDQLFGKPAANVHETLSRLFGDESACDLLCSEGVFNERLLRSYGKAMLDQWELELGDRLIEENLNLVRQTKCLHRSEQSFALDYDSDLKSYQYLDGLWQEIQNLRAELALSNADRLSIFRQIYVALQHQELYLASQLQQEMELKIQKLRELYHVYKQSIL